MNTKIIFKTLALAMLMPAMLLTTACGNQDDIANTSNITNKGYALPVTVNVTRGDGATRATFDGSKLNFSDGDKLFVEGKYATGSKSFAGALEYVSEGTFSGTIYAQDNTYSTYDALLTAASSVKATLLPNGYGSTGFLSIDNNNTTDIAYDDVISATPAKAFVASGTAKANGVEQLSLEQATTYSSGFALAPQCAILNFTISGLAAGAKNVTLGIHHSSDYTVTGSVTPNGSGVATFAIGVAVGANIKNMENNLTVGSKFTLSSTTTFTAGKIYNITRVANAINGKFSVSGTKKVYFSKSNLRYASSKWSFFDHQYDCYSSYNANTWDMFGWSTSKSSYGKTTSTTAATYQGSFVNWGNVIGSGWSTLSRAEWTYLFKTRGSAAKKYGYATVNGVNGIIILPDAFVDPNKNNGSNAFAGSTTTKGWNANVYTSANWALMEANGAVFLPAAGSRYGTTVGGGIGYYWSSTSKDTNNAYDVCFASEDLYFDSEFSVRSKGMSVRLVRVAN